MHQVYASFWDDFEDPLKVVFDGIDRKIYISPQYSIIDVKVDIYSASKKWISRRQNAGYLPPLRSIGGDPVGGGLYAGDIYFLINNWQIIISHSVSMNGILYQDNPQLSTYVILPGGGVTSTVSSLAYAYNTTGASVTLSDIENSPMIAKQSTLNNVWKATKLATALSA